MCWDIGHLGGRVGGRGWSKDSYWVRVRARVRSRVRVRGKDPSDYALDCALN